MLGTLRTAAGVALGVAIPAILALWAVSLFRYDLVSYRTPGGAWTATLLSSDGGVGVTATWMPVSPSPHPATGWHWSSLPHVGRGGLGLDPLHTVPHLLGLGGRAGGFPGPFGQSYRVALVAPWWAVFLVVLLPSLLLAPRALRDRVALGRRRRGHCVACGYDLRGVAGRAACPECGAPAPAPEPGPSSAPPPASPGSPSPATAASAR